MALAGLGDVDFVGGDVVEVSPPYDHADITALAAATVAMHYIGLLATRRRQRLSSQPLSSPCIALCSRLALWRIMST